MAAMRDPQRRQEDSILVRGWRRLENRVPQNLRDFYVSRVPQNWRAFYVSVSIFDPDEDSDRRHWKKPDLSLLECTCFSIANIAWQPWRVAQTLIQLGYEPVAPGRRFSFMFQSHMYYYPGVIGYCRALYRQSGWGALFIGTKHVFLLNFASLSAASAIRPFVISGFNSLLVPYWEHWDDAGAAPQNRMSNILISVSHMFMVSMVTTLAVELFVHPLKVITVRCIAQYVGGERTYDHIWPSLRHIYRTEGLAGLYSGLIPNLLGSVCRITIHCSLWLLFDIIAANMSSKVRQSLIRLMCLPLLSLLPQSYAYPFYNVSTHMMVKGVDLAVAKTPYAIVHHGWVDCFRHLKSNDRLYWGSKLLMSRFVYAKPPSP